MRMWLNFSRQNMKLKEMISDIVQMHLKGNCSRCKSRYRLQVIQKVPFTDIVQKYKVQMKGLPFNKIRWRKFYRRH